MASPSARVSRTSLAPLSALDHGLACYAGGDALGALRHALPALGDHDARGTALDLAARALRMQDENALADRAFALAVPWLINAGLGGAALAAALDAGEAERESLLLMVARAFSAQSKPPAKTRLPALSPPRIAPLSGELDLKALAQNAARSLDFLEPPAPGEPAVAATLPLLGSLDTDDFVRVARALRVQSLLPDAELVHEGEAGDRAFLVARGAVVVSRTVGDEELELAALGPGSVVGEMALVTSAPRAATVRGERASLLLVLPREALDVAVAEQPLVGQQIVAFCRRRLVSLLVRTSPLLREVPAEERDGLIAAFETRTYEPGVTLITQGDAQAGLHLIAAGLVSVVRTDETGQQLTLSQLGPGNVVGEISLVLRKPASATVVAVEPTVSLVLPPARFHEVIRGRPTLLAHLYELAVRREDETLSVLACSTDEIDDAVLI